MRTPSKTTKHQTREVEIWAQYHSGLQIVKSGKWQEVIQYLNSTYKHRDTNHLFLLDTDGTLHPLMQRLAHTNQ